MSSSIESNNQMEDYPFKTYKGFLEALNLFFSTELYGNNLPKLKKYMEKNDYNILKIYKLLPKKEKSSHDIVDFISMLVHCNVQYSTDDYEDLFEFIDYLLDNGNSIFPSDIIFSVTKCNNKNEIGNYYVRGPIINKYSELIKFPEGWDELEAVEDWESYQEQDIEENFETFRLRYLKYFVEDN